MFSTKFSKQYYVKQNRKCRDTKTKINHITFMTFLVIIFLLFIVYSVGKCPIYYIHNIVLLMIIVWLTQ